MESKHVTQKQFRRPLVLFLILEGILFALSLPGVGIETRKVSDYASWAGPIFLGLTLLIFGGVIAAVALARRTSRSAAYLGFMVAIAAVAIVLFDLSAVGGPPDPPGPLGLSAVVLLVSALILFVALGEIRGPPPPAA